MLLVSFCSPPHNTFSIHKSWILMVIWFWCFAGRRLWWDENERSIAIKMHFWIRKISFSSVSRKTRSRSIAWIQFFFFWCVSPPRRSSFSSSISLHYSFIQALVFFGLLILQLLLSTPLSVRLRHDRSGVEEREEVTRLQTLRLMHKQLWKTTRQQLG